VIGSSESGTVKAILDQPAMIASIGDRRRLRIVCVPSLLRSGSRGGGGFSPGVGASGFGSDSPRRW
jgi:hypothetical protein